VSERERGVWRRYRLLPAPGGTFISSILIARLVLLVTAALLQLALGFVLGLPWPSHPAGLAVTFLFTAFAFMGIGLTIAMLVDNVPAVQALGQCIFLPMLILGGVAVQLESLPAWVQHVSAFFPGRYAVEAQQRCFTGAGLDGAGFDLLALFLMGLAGAISAAGMFRWDRSFAPNKVWLVVAFGMWLVVGVIAEQRDEVGRSRMADTQAVGTSQDYAHLSKASTAMDWQGVTEAELDAVAFDRLPLDSGIIAPVSRSDETPDPLIQPLLDQIRDGLAVWKPGNISDPAQRARNLLSVAAVPDILQMEPVERFVPRLVFARLQAVIPPRDLPKILYWIAMHPDVGDDSAIRQLRDLGLPQIQGPTKPVRGRIMIYAFKMLGRLTGKIPPI
jgi:ABC-2 type transport system permease protein